MTEPGHDPGLDMTVLDAGRSRLFPPRPPGPAADPPPTIVDAGRGRSEAPTDESLAWPEGDRALPAELAGRYDLQGRLDVPSSQARLFLVRVRETGELAVIKRYHPGQVRHPEVEALRQIRPARVVRFLEFGPGYEVMEHLDGSSLHHRREANPGAFGFETLRTITEQVAAGLIALHRQGLVHRDVKPANILSRSSDGRDTVLIDLGLAGPFDGPRMAELVETEGISLRYQPPEYANLREVSEATDWWGLGVTLVELAAGEHPLPDLTNEDFRHHYGSHRAIDVSGVPDDDAERHSRLRNLCQGLLCPDNAERWGADQVRSWLGGEDPPLPGGHASWAAGPEPTQAAQPYVFRGVEYYSRADLAVAMKRAWNYAALTDFSSSGLREWLEHFTDTEGTDARRVLDDMIAADDIPPDVRLLRILQALDPTGPPIYRNHTISRTSLLWIAHRAINNEGDSASVLADLWNHHLLPYFDTAAPGTPDIGTEGLAVLDRVWRDEVQRWPSLVGHVRDDHVRAQLARPDAMADMLAYCLRAATRDPQDIERAREHLRLNEPVATVPWFAAISRRPELIWLTLAVLPFARTQARSIVDEHEARVAAVEYRRMSAGFREWSRRQNRPVALGWAVAGVSLMAVLWIALIAAADAADRSTDPVVDLAWVVAAACFGVTLVAECLLGAELGGRFHPRYSMPGAAAIALRPLGRWMQRSPLPAAGIILLVLCVLVLVAADAPPAVPAGATVGHLLWVLQRWLAWNRQQDAEDNRVTETWQGGPSEVDGGPVRTDRGAV